MIRSSPLKTQAPKAVFRKTAVVNPFIGITFSANRVDEATSSTSCLGSSEQMRRTECGRTDQMPILQQPIGFHKKNISTADSKFSLAGMTIGNVTYFMKLVVIVTNESSFYFFPSQNSKELIYWPFQLNLGGVTVSVYLLGRRY